MDSEDAIEREFKAGELEHIYAVQRLENLGYLPKDAENKVEEWGLKDEPGRTRRDQTCERSQRT